jgi:hypothetical protein
MKIKAPRLETATRITIVGSEPREYINDRGEIREYFVAMCQSDEHTFEVSWTRIGFRGAVGDRKVKLRTDAGMGIATPVTLRTFIGAKEIGYICEIIEPVVTPDEAAASASVHAVH